LEWNFALPTTTHNNQPLVDMGEPRASQCLAHLEYIQVGERRQELVLVWDLAAYQQAARAWVQVWTRSGGRGVH
jgi:hypothetical protein